MIRTRDIVVTQQDLDRLRALLHESRESRREGETDLHALDAELYRATVVSPEDVPADAVTMNSTVRIAVDGRHKHTTWTIVYPHDANMDEGHISVLTPLGTALLGYREGDTLEWDFPAGRRTCRVVEVIHQPEAAGEWDR